MRKRVGVDPKTGSKSKSMTSAPGRLTLIGQSRLLEGEDAAAYDELLARIRAAVTPVDVIDEMFIIDVASLDATLPPSNRKRPSSRSRPLNSGLGWS